MGQLQGDLSVMSLADLAIWFANRGVTGELTVERGTTRKEYAIENGFATRASSNDPREYFGQFLMHFGLLTEDQLERAFETQRETKVYLGRILVMIGIVPEDKIVQTLHVKISESMLDALRWTQGRFTFVDNAVEHVRPQVDLRVSLVDVHREAMRRSAIWDQFNAIFPTQQVLLAVNDARIPLGLTIDTLDGRIIALARHGMNIESLALELHATDYQVAARLFELHRAGIIEPREPTDQHGRAELTIPPGLMTHADLARRAMAAQDYTSAFKHVQAQADMDPANTELTELSVQIEGKFREHLSEVVSRDTIPAVIRELSEQDKKRLSPKQRYILARIDGRRSVQAIIQVSPMRDVEAMEIIRFFKREGIIRL
jgi:hypothetical protein